METILNELLNSDMQIYLFIVLFMVGLILLIIVTVLLFNTNKEASNTYQEAKDIVESLLSESEQNEYDIAKISKALENERGPVSDVQSFEQEQEEKAIISYDQLINKVNKECDIPVTKVILPETPKNSHHREDLNKLINQEHPKVAINPSQLTQTKSYLEDLKTLHRKLK